MRPIALAALTLCLLALGGCGDDDRGPAADVAASFFGVAPQDATSDVDLTRMAEGGVGSYHLLFSWPRIEKDPGAYDWSSYDALIGKLAALEITPIPYVFGTPKEFADDPTVPPTESEEALRAWDRFLEAAAERYGAGGEFWQQLAETDPGVEPRPLQIWEIWNEVNAPAFWKDPSPADYATLLKRAERSLHSVDPEAQIMVAGMFATPTKSDDAILSFDFLRELFKQRNVTEAVDLVAVHPYGPRVSDVADQIDRTREEVDRAGLEEAGIWITEFGWGSNPEVSSQLGVSPDEQGGLLRESYEMLIAERDRWKIEGALWYTWRDPTNPVGLCGWCVSAGLLDNDLDPKPAWREYTRLTGGEAIP